MSLYEIIVEEDKKKDHSEKKDIVRFRGKNIKIKKLQKKIRHKPRLLFPIVINLGILLVIIIFVLLFFELGI